MASYQFSSWVIYFLVLWSIVSVSYGLYGIVTNVSGHRFSDLLACLQVNPLSTSASCSTAKATLLSRWNDHYQEMIKNATYILIHGLMVGALAYYLNRSRLVAR